MLVDLLDQSIIAMKEIYELEKSSNDVQKQEKNDKIFSNVVSENHLMVKAVTDSMSQLGFVISQETRGKVIGCIIYFFSLWCNTFYSLKHIYLLVCHSMIVDYASKKIKLGASWDFKQDNLDKMEKGLQEADEIINSLGFGEDGAEIIAFLKKVASGKASVHDLTPDILNWLMENKMTSKLAVSFK